MKKEVEKKEVDGVHLTSDEIAVAIVAVTQARNVYCGNFLDIVFCNEWEGLSEEDSFRAVDLLDQAHKILLKLPASINRTCAATQFGAQLEKLLTTLNNAGDSA